MDDNTIEIHDDEINVKEIMAKIRENIRRRQAAGELPPDPDSAIESPSKYCPAGESDEAIGRDLSNINANWDIHNNSYFISSHHPCIGTVLVKGRQLVHGEVCRYVDPMIFRQTSFNSSVVRLLNHTSQNCAELEHNISHQNEELTQKILQQDDVLTQKISQQQEVLTQKISQQEDALTQKISQQEGVLTQKISQWDDVLTQKISHQNEELNTHIQNYVDSNFREVFSHLDKDLRLQMGLTQLLEERMRKGLAQRGTPSESTATIPNDTNYFLFEERFRGSREDIRQRQLAFLPYFEKCSRVLDIGSGRGEFLEILKDHDIGGIGVDIDPDMVAYCRSRQLEVEHSDALTYLETLEDKSLDGIFIDQVVEHLEPDYLIRLIALCHQKMKFGYHIVIETVNPLSFVSFANFYIDLTHKRPVHPETLQYLITAVGFRECEKKFFSPVSDAGRLKKIEMTVDMHETERKNVDVYNHNIEMLNSILFGAQDYAVVGKK